MKRTPRKGSKADRKAWKDLGTVEQGRDSKESYEEKVVVPLKLKAAIPKLAIPRHSMREVWKKRKAK